MDRETLNALIEFIGEEKIENGFIKFDTLRFSFSSLNNHKKREKRIADISNGKPFANIAKTHKVSRQTIYNDNKKGREKLL